jgi:hypothetical protein
MADGIAAIIGALKDLRVSAQVSLATTATALILLGATFIRGIATLAPGLLEWRAWLFLAAVAGLALFLVGLGADALKARSERKKVAAAESAFTEKRILTLKQLTIDEQNRLRTIMLSASRASETYSRDSTIFRLMERGIIEQVGEKFNRGANERLGVSISDWAWIYLREHPELLGVTPDHLPPIGEEINRRRERGGTPDTP